MSTLLNLLAGTGSVTVLFIAMLIYKAVGTLSSEKTSGIGALAGVISWIIVNPGFWLSALLLLFGVFFLNRRQHRLRHSRS